MLRPADFQQRRTRVVELDAKLVCICIEPPVVAEHSLAPFDALTESERAVVELVARGLPNRRIAELRAASASTIANQLTAAYRKLGVKSRRELRALLGPLSD